MVNIRSANEIIQNLVDHFRLVQPDLDTKPNTVARDLMIESPAIALGLVYDELSSVINANSLRLVVGSDLDKLAKNFGLTRKQSTSSAGVALLTFTAIVANIPINAGDLVIATNGLSFQVAAGTTVTTSALNFYRSIASKYQSQLTSLGINDQYAVEVSVTSSTSGSAGNISSFSLNSTNISDVSNITNINNFTGGTDQETDAVFRSRILASFNGSSVGTALGYLNVALGTTGVEDAAVIEPGDPLMTRDGTITTTNSDGTLTIVSEGTGGKVDIVVLGSNNIETTNTYIFVDKATNDPTNPKNNIVIGQIAADAGKTITQKRIDDIANGQLPTQPVEQIFEVVGSLSGPNFQAKSVDDLNRVSGNYELIKDTGFYSGSAFGFDTFAWITNKISDFSENLVKGQFNGQDATTYSDVLDISQVQQNLSITNENSTVTTDRSILQLLHYPISNVTRVFNTNTGERYVIINQNVDGTGSLNTSGRIQISGNTLPSPSDILQVDYNWIVTYDNYSDFDGLSNTFNVRNVTDSIDWGYSSIVKNEIVPFSLSVGNNYYTGNVSHPISTIISTNTYFIVDGSVSRITSGLLVNRLAININNLAVPTTSVNSVIFKNNNTELYDTVQNNGTFTNTPVVVGINVLYDTQIVLPSDTLAVEGSQTTILLNVVDIYNSTSIQGSSNGTQITIPSSLVSATDQANINLQVSYIANLPTIMTSAVTSLPASQSGNGYLLSNNNGSINFSIVNNTRRESLIVQQNLSSQFYVELNLPSTSFSLSASEVIAVPRLSDGKELWDGYYFGTVAIGNSGNYQLIFSGHNTPAIGDRVIAIYYAQDLKRFQPFTFSNTLIKQRVDQIQLDGILNKFTVPLNSFVAEPSGVDFLIIDPNTETTIQTITDGYLTVSGSTAILSSLSFNFATIPDIVNKQVKIELATKPNNGLYDIVSYNSTTNDLVITNVYNNILPDQVSIVRLLDGKELFNYSGSIDIANNRVILPSTALVNQNDYVFVMFFNFANLKQSATKIISNITDQVVNTGTITIAGKTLFKAQDVIFTATANGLSLNLNEALRDALNLASSATIPTNIQIVKLIKLEKVLTGGPTNTDVLSTVITFDTLNTQIKNNLLYAETMAYNNSLDNFSFILPSTPINTLKTNSPALGDRLRATFYYTVDNDTESLVYTRNGTLYTNKQFAIINKIYVNSGFKSSNATKLTLSFFNQPTLGTRYSATYDYTAPKNNERITISFNYNQLISDATFNIEAARPITADVLTREATLLLLDLTMNVVIVDSFITSGQTNTVLQNLRDQLNTVMTTNKLNQVIDQVTLINIAQSVNGIARARILYFNVTGQPGQVLIIQAQKNQYFQPNVITLNTEVR